MRFSKALAFVLAALPLVGMAQSLPSRPFPNRDNALNFLPRGPMNEIMQGQVLVKLRPSLASKMVAQAKDNLRVELASKLPRATDIVPGGRIRSQIGPSGWTLWLVDKRTNVRQLVEEVKKDPRVLAAQPVNRIYPLLAEPNDPDWQVWETDPNLLFSLEGDVLPFRRLWHLIETGAWEGWNVWPNTYYNFLTKPSNAPLIAIIDTGCDMNHPDFRNAGGSSTNSAMGGQLDWARSGRFELGEKVPGSPEDLNGHGTHVAGIALASGNNGQFSPGVNQGTIGTGYPCTGIILRVFDDSGVGTDADAAAAMYEAIAQGADVINLSLGTTNFSQLFQDAVTYAHQSGALVVAAGNESGNGGGNLGPIYPAACSGALAVTANGENMLPATSTYAGYGSYIDIAAPGGDVFIDMNPLSPQYKIQFVYSTSSRDPGTSLHNNTILFPPYELNYAYLAGTSMASPAVAGAAGLFFGQRNLDQRSGWANVQAYRALQRSAHGVMGAPRGSWEYYQGYGSLNIEGLLTDSSPRAASVGAMEGIVYFNGTALSNVTVRAQRPGSPIRYQTTTRADGTYRFEMLPPGVYNVTAIPFGTPKTKSSTVMAGSDQTGLDFWCGIYTGDETPPVVGRFDWLSYTPTAISLRHWGYDPETAIDRMSMRIGTTVGGTDVMADREVLPETPDVSFTGLNIPPFHAFQARYTNGGNMTTTVTRATLQVRDDAFVRDGSFASTNYGQATTLVSRRTPTAGFTRRIYMKIDLGAIPGQFTNVTLRFMARKWAGTPTVLAEVFPTGTNWSESTLTWNNAPAASGPAVANTVISAISPGAFAWHSVDLTAYAQAERAAGRNSIGVFITPTMGADGFDAYSGEWNLNAPRFEIEARG